LGGIEGLRRFSIRRRSAGKFQIYDDSRCEGINRRYEFDDEPVGGLFGDFAAAEKEFFGTHPGFDPES
jgi:hypothetical protein